MDCPPVRGHIPRTFKSGLSYVREDKHGITILYHYISVDLAHYVIFCAKIVSMIRKYHNHKPQTTLWHREEEPLNYYETPGRQIKQSNQLSLPHQDDCNTGTDTKQRTTKHRTITDSHNG